MNHVNLGQVNRRHATSPQRAAARLCCKSQHSAGEICIIILWMSYLDHQDIYTEFASRMLGFTLTELEPLLVSFQFCEKRVMSGCQKERP